MKITILSLLFRIPETNWGSLKKSEMRWMQGTGIEDVYLILRNGCNEADTIFLASLKNLHNGANSNLQCTGYL